MLKQLSLVNWATLAVAGCGVLLAPSVFAGDQEPGRYPYKITCTTGMVADIVREIVGEKAVVDNIIGEGVDPHLYTATRSDITKMLKSDIIFYNGLMLEGKMADSLRKIGKKMPSFAIGELIDKPHLATPKEQASHDDPHVWMDVSLWIQAAEKASEALCDYDPASASYYRERWADYKKQLEALDLYAKTCITSIPEEQRVLVTAHDAFNYFGHAYNIEVVGIQGISTESEAGISDINTLVKMLAARNVKAIFVETSVSDKNVKALIEGAQAIGHTVRIGGALFSDAMGKSGTYEGTYIGMIDHNVTLMTRALGGQAPEKGMLGKLTSQAD